jgi:hypothetical protein
MSLDNKIAVIIVAAGENPPSIPLYERGTKEWDACDDVKNKCHRLPLVKGE